MTSTSLSNSSSSTLSCSIFISLACRRMPGSCFTAGLRSMVGLRFADFLLKSLYFFTLPRNSSAYCWKPVPTFHLDGTPISDKFALLSSVDHRSFLSEELWDALSYVRLVGQAREIWPTSPHCCGKRTRDEIQKIFFHKVFHKVSSSLY